MGALLASSLISSASEILSDVEIDNENVTWTETQMLAWLNDGQRAVASQRPDASSSTVTFQLTAGETKQSIAGERLLSVIRNMGTDGLTPGIAPRQVPMDAKNEFEPDWPTHTADTAIKEYMFDPRKPEQFYVYPPVHAVTAVYVETLQAVTPTDVADVDTAITLSDNYAPALIEWMVYRGLLRESEETPVLQRAVASFQAFFNILGTKLQIDMAISPKVREALE